MAACIAHQTTAHLPYSIVSSSADAHSKLRSPARQELLRSCKLIPSPASRSHTLHAPFLRIKSVHRASSSVSAIHTPPSHQQHAKSPCCSSSEARNPILFTTTKAEDPLCMLKLSKDWQESKREEDPIVLAELRLLANVAKDRAEMHSILAQQRDNCNKLFQSTLTMATLTATVLAALNGQHTSSCLSLGLPALFLNVGAGFMMCVINQFQPSQLAEEQRTASRLFRKLGNDIEYGLEVSPHLRQDARCLLQDSQGRLQSLDQAYPLPLTPGGLEKFPKHITPPCLRRRKTDTISEEIPPPLTSDNGWDGEISGNLGNVAQRLHDSDTKIYLGWARNVVRVNKGFAIAAPLLAFLGAALNAVGAFGICNTGLFAALSSLLSTFVSSFSHDMQLGMVFELYRNSAGYYDDIGASIQQVLRLPVEKRENGALFHSRVAYELGRPTERRPMIPKEAKTGGTLF